MASAEQTVPEERATIEFAAECQSTSCRGQAKKARAPAHDDIAAETAPKDADGKVENRAVDEVAISSDDIVKPRNRSKGKHAMKQRQQPA